MAVIKKEIRDEISSQAINEIEFARKYKRQRISNWHKNEEMYYGKKRSTDSERANVELGKMQEFVHTLLSKIDTPLVFKFNKKKNADLVKAERANALRRIDANDNDWDMKDLLGKKQAIIYGRAIYAYHAESNGGFYNSILENVDAYDFLIDPAVGGLDIENALYMGRGNVNKLASELEAGAKGKNKIYIKSEVDLLLQGGGNSTDKNKETTDKQPRSTSADGEVEKEIGHNEKYKLYEWWTTYKGDRYYLLLDESSGRAIRVEKWTDLSKEGLYPFWTWASYPDLTEFWTPSYCDYVREIFMAQAVSINQMLDNSEQINKPQRAIDTTAIVDEGELKYRKNGWIRLNTSDDINKVFRTLETPSIDTPIKTYELLEAIAGKASGVTADAKGVSEEEKVTIYKGNLQAINDRFDFLNKSYTHGYKRFAKLYYNGIKEHLKKKVAVELMGADGVQIAEITKTDIVPKGGRDFSVIVESSNTELQVSALEKQAQDQFLVSLIGMPEINNKKIIEKRGMLVGFKEEEMADLFDVEGTGDARLMAEADRDIETILDGKEPPINLKANTAYKRRIVDYMQSNSEYLDDEQFEMLTRYILQKLDPIIIENTVAKAQNQINQQIITGQNPNANPNPAIDIGVEGSTDPNAQV